MDSNRVHADYCKYRENLTSHVALRPFLHCEADFLVWLGISMHVIACLRLGFRIIWPSALQDTTDLKVGALVLRSTDSLSVALGFVKSWVSTPQPRHLHPSECNRPQMIGPPERLIFGNLKHMKSAHLRASTKAQPSQHPKKSLLLLARCRWCR